MSVSLRSTFQVCSVITVGYVSRWGVNEVVWI